MFAHVKKNLLHLPDLHNFCSVVPELAPLQIIMEGTKAQHSSVMKKTFLFCANTSQALGN
jgi:hypothetical protein